MPEEARRKKVKPEVAESEREKLDCELLWNGRIVASSLSVCLSLIPPSGEALSVRMCFSLWVIWSASSCPFLSLFSPLRGAWFCFRLSPLFLHRRRLRLLLSFSLSLQARKPLSCLLLQSSLSCSAVLQHLFLPHLLVCHQTSHLRAPPSSSASRGVTRSTPTSRRICRRPAGNGKMTAKGQRGQWLRPGIGLQGGLYGQCPQPDIILSSQSAMDC